MVKKYIPKQCDIVYFDFNPTKGHEQNEYRPVEKVSNNDFEEIIRLLNACIEY